MFVELDSQAKQTWSVSLHEKSTVSIVSRAMGKNALWLNRLDQLTSQDRQRGRNNGNNINNSSSNPHFLNSYYVPGTWYIFHICFSHLFLTTTLWGYYDVGPMSTSIWFCLLVCTKCVFCASQDTRYICKHILYLSMQTHILSFYPSIQTSIYPSILLPYSLSGPHSMCMLLLFQFWNGETTLQRGTLSKSWSCGLRWEPGFEAGLAQCSLSTLPCYLIHKILRFMKF